MFNVITQRAIKEPNTQDKVYGVMLWDGTRENVYISGASLYSLSTYGGLPCKNISTGEVRTAAELMGDGYRRAGVDTGRYAPFAEEAREYGEEATFSDIIQKGLCPGVYVRSAIRGIKSITCNDFILVFPFEEYRDYIRGILPDTYKEAAYIDTDGYKYIYHIQKNIWNINVCALRTGIMVVNFGDGTYQDNDAQIEDYTSSYYKMHKEKLLRVIDKDALIHVVDYEKESFDGSSAGSR
jgi:hypothetical protein